MTLKYQIITIAVILLGTVLTRFLPYILFPAGRETPPLIQYLGKVLAPAVFGLLIVYCFRNSHGVNEGIGLIATVICYAATKKMLPSMALGTICYVVLVNLAIF